MSLDIEFPHLYEMAHEKCTEACGLPSSKECKKLELKEGTKIQCKNCNGIWKLKANRILWWIEFVWEQQANTEGKKYFPTSTNKD